MFVKALEKWITDNMTTLRKEEKQEFFV